MDNKEIIKILNQSAKSMFKDSISVIFRMSKGDQIILDVSGVYSAYSINGRVLKKSKTKSIIESVKRDSSELKCLELILNLLRDITYGEIDWNQYIKVNTNIDEEIVNKAKKVLREHINDVKEIYLIPIEEKIDSLNIDKSTLNKVWKEYIIPKYKVIEKINSFRSYSTIKKTEEYPYLILSSKTGRILLTEETTGHFLKVENIEAELSKIKETECILDKCGDNIKPFLIIKEYIDENKIKYTSKIENSNELKEYGPTFDYEYFYSNRINSEVKMNLIEGTLILKGNKCSLKDIGNDISPIQNEIDKVFELTFNEVLGILGDKVKARKEKFNKPYMIDILNLLCDFPQKGITTYVSILSGEKSHKISSNDYDKSASYGKMSDCKKTFITDKIREFIDIGVIDEDYYKASFGHYIGLTLSEEARDYIDNCNMDDVANDIEKNKNIDSLKELISELRDVVSVSRAKSLLMGLSNTELPFKKDDLNSLLDFIESDRAIYREYEDIFTENISKMVPAQYRPIFLLNSNMTTGVTKKTLKSIYDQMEIL